MTWLSRGILFIFFFLLAFGIVKLLPRFLSINKPIGEGILVLDGQIPDYVVEEAIKVFESGNYSMVITTGSNLNEGFYLSEMKTMAELTKGTFLAIGFDSTKVIALPTTFVKRNRTFNSANTLNEWLLHTHPEIDKIDVLTVSCHARRSYFLFKKALPDDKQLGIIAIDHKGYDDATWWKSSIGARMVISETISYIYALLTT